MRIQDFAKEGGSSGSSARVGEGPRNMKSMRPPLAAIFFMTYGPLAPRSATGGGGDFCLRPKVSDVAKYSCISETSYLWLRFLVFNAQICILTHSRDTFSLIVSARKRNLGQGNVFIGVCLPTKEGGWLPSMHHRSHDQYDPGRLKRYIQTDLEEDLIHNFWPEG